MKKRDPKVYIGIRIHKSVMDKVYEHVRATGASVPDLIERGLMLAMPPPFIGGGPLPPPILPPVYYPYPPVPPSPPPSRPKPQTKITHEIIEFPKLESGE